MTEQKYLVVQYMTKSEQIIQICIKGFGFMIKSIVIGMVIWRIGIGGVGGDNFIDYFIL